MEQGFEMLVIRIETECTLQDVAKIEQKLAILALHHVGLHEGSDICGLQARSEALVVAVAAIGKEPDVEDAVAGRRECADFAGCRDGCRHHHRDAVDLLETAERKALVGNAVLNAEDRLRVDSRGAQPLQGGKRVLRLHGQ